jgi:uncharacterized protein (TIGR02145 family)
MCGTNFKILLFIIVGSLTTFQSIAQVAKKMPDKNRWTLSNLDLDIAGSYYYNDSLENGEKYGRLYTWEAAQRGCSSLGKGWHLPSTEEWHDLLKYFGGAFSLSGSDGKEAFKKLLHNEKTTFGATLGGNRNVDGTYDRIEAHGFYWTSTKFDPGNAGFLNFANGRKVLFLQPDMEIDRAISVRCIKTT